MLRSYIRVALRGLARNRVSSLINIGGLAIGMAVAMLIGLWVHDELSFNKHFEHYDRIGKIWQFVTFDKGKVPYDVIPEPMGQELRSNYPDFKRVSMAAYNQSVVLTSGDKKLTELGTYVEPEFTEMMSLDMRAGRRDALRDMHTILLDASAAKAMFGAEDPLGRVIRISDTINVKVAGVYEDFPENSTFNGVHFLSPWSLYQATDGFARSARGDWGNNSFQVFVELKDGAGFGQVSAKIRDILLKRKDPPVYRPEFFVFPMRRWHLYLDFQNGVNVGGFISSVRLFALIGIFVLLLACINFMNLSTARSEKRAREVGIRKTIGSVREQLILQFFCESLLVALLAFTLALVLAWLILPFFNDLSGKHMAMPWNDPLFWLAGTGFSIATGLIAGSYPALYLSSFRPVKVLKGTIRVGRLAALPRRVLVVLQFSVSVALIIGTAVVFRQIQYAKNRTAGYNRDGVVEVNINTPALSHHFDALRGYLLATGGVYDVAEASCALADQNGGTTDISWKTKDPNVHPLVMSNEVTPEFGRVAGWRVTRGRDFSRDFPTDSSAMILNESAVKLMGFANPLGETVTHNGRDYHVIGVVSDMLKESPFERVKPSFFDLDHGASVIDIKLTPGMPVHEALAKVEGVFKKFNPGSPFTCSFVDANFAQKFRSEERIGKLATFFALLAIFISCLGLFGLASFVAEQRTKEIGIRKVLGASLFHVWRLLTTEFVFLVSLSLLIAIPVSFVYMQGWLEHYDFRTTLAWWIFAGAGLGAILITLATVSFQAIRAALANPVKSLRTE